MIRWEFRLLGIFLAGLLFYLITGDVSIASLLVILISYLEFRKKKNNFN